MSRQTIILPQMKAIMKADYEIMKQADFCKKYKMSSRTAIRHFGYKIDKTKKLPEIKDFRRYRKPAEGPKDYSIFNKQELNYDYYKEPGIIINKCQSILDLYNIKYDKRN